MPCVYYKTPEACLDSSLKLWNTYEEAMQVPVNRKRLLPNRPEFIPIPVPVEEKTEEEKIYRLCTVKFRLDATPHYLNAGRWPVKPGDYVLAWQDQEHPSEPAIVISVRDYAETAFPIQPDIPPIIKVLQENDLRKMKKDSEAGVEKNIQKKAPVQNKRKLSSPGKRAFRTTLMLILISWLVLLLTSAIVDYKKYYIPGYNVQEVKDVLEKAKNHTPRPTVKPDNRPTSVPGSIPRPTQKSSSSSNKSDPYDAKSYAHPDDFYYDYREDFWDYEDAEDYWEKYS